MRERGTKRSSKRGTKNEKKISYQDVGLGNIISAWTFLSGQHRTTCCEFRFRTDKISIAADWRAFSLTNFVKCSLENVSRAGRPLLLRKPEQMRMVNGPRVPVIHQFLYMADFGQRNKKLWYCTSQVAYLQNRPSVIVKICRALWHSIPPSARPFARNNQKEEKRTAASTAAGSGCIFFYTCSGMIQYDNRSTYQKEVNGPAALILPTCLSYAAHWQSPVRVLAMLHNAGTRRSLCTSSSSSSSQISWDDHIHWFFR